MLLSSFFLSYNVFKIIHFTCAILHFFFLARVFLQENDMIRKIRWAVLLSFLFAGTQLLFSQGKIYAVLVGVSEYVHQENNLTYSHWDAITMYEFLKEYTTPDRMVLLTNQQALHDNIVYYAGQLFRQAGPDDIVLFFFSGHGDPNVFYTHDKALHFNTLYGIFKQTQARRRLIFADACFSGTLRKLSDREDSGKSTAGIDLLIFLSSRSSQYSREDLSLKNGAFTYFLLAGLRGGADFNRDSYITAKELFDFVNPKVKERTRGTQVPVMWGQFNVNMVILKRKSNK